METNLGINFNSVILARKRTSGKVDETDESEGEHLDQTMDQTQSMDETNETSETTRDEETTGSSVEEANQSVEKNVGEQQNKMGEEDAAKKEEGQNGAEVVAEGEPSMKQAKTDE